MNTVSSIETLIKKIDSSELFVRAESSDWSNAIACEICLDGHELQKVLLRPVGSDQEAPLNSSVRLSDGINQVDITYESTCMDAPFRNTAKLLSKLLGLPITSDHQVFDSLGHLYSSLRFSVSGFFFDWDEPVPEIWEDFETDMGHLLKMNYRPSTDGQLLDVIFEFEEFKKVQSNYQGLKAGRFGVEITISGGDSDQIVQVANDFQTALDDYAKLLAPEVS